MSFCHHLMVSSMVVRRVLSLYGKSESCLALPRSSKCTGLDRVLEDAIGVYHRIFDFSGVHIPFSSFLPAIIKHYKVHFTQLGPLGLNKSAIDDPKPVAGSYRMAGVRRLSARVVKLMEMPVGVLVLSGLSHVWKSQTCDPVC
nr:transposase (putative), gypsy type [Tanacetum cinerariifolium]